MPIFASTGTNMMDMPQNNYFVEKLTGWSEP